MVNTKEGAHGTLGLMRCWPWQIIKFDKKEAAQLSKVLFNRSNQRFDTNSLPQGIENIGLQDRFWGVRLYRAQGVGYSRVSIQSAHPLKCRFQVQ